MVYRYGTNPFKRAFGNKATRGVSMKIHARRFNDEGGGGDGGGEGGGGGGGGGGGEGDSVAGSAGSFVAQNKSQGIWLRGRAGEEDQQDDKEEEGGVFCCGYCSG